MTLKRETKIEVHDEFVMKVFDVALRRHSVEAEKDAKFIRPSVALDVIVRHDVYKLGDVYGKSPEDAVRLLRRGFVKLHDPPTNDEALAAKGTVEKPRRSRRGADEAGALPDAGT